MSLDTPYRLPKSVRPAVPVVRMGYFMLVIYDDCPLFRVLWVMQIPVMAGVSAYDRRVISIRNYDRKVCRIQTFQILTAEHRHPPSLKTTLPEPAPPLPPSEPR